MTGEASYSPDDEQQLDNLIVRISHKDEDAMETLYDMACGKVFGLASAIVKDHDIASEVTLDVFTKVWHNADQFNPKVGSARAWLSVLSRNCSLDHLRKLKRRSRWEDEHAREHNPTCSQEAGQEHMLFDLERAGRIGQAMLALNEDQRTVITAAYFEGLSHSHISKLTGKPLGTVKSQIRKALDILRRSLEPSKGAIL